MKRYFYHLHDNDYYLLVIDERKLVHKPTAACYYRQYRADQDYSQRGTPANQSARHPAIAIPVCKEHYASR